MKTYRIRPITLARAKSDKGPMTYLVHYGEKIWRPYIFWIIEGAEKNIIVDTAIHADDYKSYHRGFKNLSIEHLMHFEEGLSKASLTPDDIDMVIQTHLHFDHCHNTLKCKNARVLVQEEELRFARDPHPVFAAMYAPDLLDGIDFETVRGRRSILPGIEVIPVPGHTPGCQAVAVDTEAGCAVISGFCSTMDNFFPAEDIRETVSPFAGYPVTIPGIHYNAFEAYQSILEIKALADIVLPVHEPGLMTVDTIPEN
jgi:glyoxylase-like metal-dependent hydrolase (beta-lactamase superfamily II)